MNTIANARKIRMKTHLMTLRVRENLTESFIVKYCEDNNVSAKMQHRLYNELKRLNKIG
jgi:hypothetical protein